MARFSYIRPTKARSEEEQRATLNGMQFDEEYVEAKPKRDAPPPSYWWKKLVQACRPGESDEVHVSHAGVIADSMEVAIERLGELTARETALVVASSGKRYLWHPDAALAMEVAAEIVREARVEAGRRGGAKFAKMQAEKRAAEEAKWEEAKRLWLDTSIPVEDVYAYTKLTRNQLYQRFGPSGRKRFKKVMRDV